MALKELTTADIREIAAISQEMDIADRPEHLTLADIGGPDWKKWQQKNQLLVDRIEALSRLARAELTALVWLGRGDSGDSFNDLVIHAARSSDRGDSRYLAAKASLHTYLQDGAARVGVAI